METSADSKLLRHGALIATISLVGLVLAGCLPENQSKGRKGDNLGAAESHPADFVNANRTAKTASGQAEPGQEATIFTAATTSYSTEDGAPRIPSIEDIPEVPANVALGRFFTGLMRLEKGEKRETVTILHIGDSHIAADRFSGSLREQFQSRFGDAGRGLLTPGLYLARGVKFDRGGKWKVALSTGEASGSFGITGAKLTANTRDAWVRLTAQDHNFAWCEITLDSGPQNGTVLISLDGDVKEASAKGPEARWRNFRIERSARELMIRPKGDGAVTIHSMAIGTDKPGVRYVNLGLPGATALTPLSWDRDYFEADLKRLAPDLIVFSYGTGESFNDQLDMSDYEAKASAAISRMRRAAPKASLLVIGPPDVAQMPKFAAPSVRASDVCRALSPAERANYAERLEANDPRLARWHPPINLDAVRATLRRLAAAHNALFWDWSKPMGGSCGIHAWVHSKPPLAANDHIHLTEEGSKRSARLLFRELMTAYDAVTRTASAKQ